MDDADEATEIQEKEEGASVACRICASEISEGEEIRKCDWCGIILHGDCEYKKKRCPNCNRFLPSAKQKALSRDRLFTIVLVTLPFAVTEVVIAIYSWLSHPSAISIPDIDNWFSLGLAVNVIVLAISLISAGSVARRGEGPEKKEEKLDQETTSSEAAD